MALVVSSGNMLSGLVSELATALKLVQLELQSCADVQSASTSQLVQQSLTGFGNANLVVVNLVDPMAALANSTADAVDLIEKSSANGTLLTCTANGTWAVASGVVMLAVVTATKCTVTWTE